MHSLRVRLVLMVASVLAITGIASALLFTRFSAGEFETFVESETRDRLDDVRTLLAEHHSAHGGWDGVEGLLDQIHRSIGRTPILLTPDGAVRVPPGSDLRGARATRQEDRVRIEWGRLEGGRDHASVLLFEGGEPIRAEGAVVGEVFLGPGDQAATEHSIRFAESLNRSAVAAVAVAGLIALLLALALSRRVLGPVERLTAAVRGMEAGRLDQRVEVRTRDEIGVLAQAFNAMASRLHANERVRRDMVSDVAHELRTPVTNLRAQIEAIQDGLASADAASLASLHEEVVHLGALIDDLGDLAAADAGQLALEPATLALHEELGRARVVLEPAARAAGVTLALDVAEALPPVRADARRLGQVVRNLVHNAVAHSPGGGTVTIAAGPAGDAVRVTVADRGPGIAREHLPRVFERFYRADPSRARATGGAGLGLAIVKQLVEAMGGAVGVESEPGEGSAFWFTLPRADAARPEAEAAPRSP